MMYGMTDHNHPDPEYCNPRCPLWDGIVHGKPAAEGVEAPGGEETINDYGFLTSAEVELFEGIEGSGDVQGLAVLVDAAIGRHLNIERTWMSVTLGHTIASLRMVAKQVADR